MKIKSVSKGRNVRSPLPPAKRYYVLLKGCKQGHLIDAYSGNDEGKIRIVKPKKGRVKAEKYVKKEVSKSFRNQRASSPIPESPHTAEISLKEYVATEALPVVKEAVIEVKKELEEKKRFDALRQNRNDEREERESKEREEKEKEQKVKKEMADKEEYEARQDQLEEWLEDED